MVKELPDSGAGLPGSGDRSQQIRFVCIPDATGEIGKPRSLQRDQPGDRLATLGNYILRAGGCHLVKKREAARLELPSLNLHSHDYDYSTMVITV